MFNIIDILGIIFVAICAIIAFKKGFVRTLFGFISTFVAIILAFALCNVGVEIIKENTNIDEWLQTTITNSLSEKVESEVTDINSNSENQENEELTKQTTDTEKNIISQILENLPENIQGVTGFAEYKETAKKGIIESSVGIILKILSWLIIYLLVRIILAIVCIIVNGIMSIPFLKQINNMAGLILGIILGLLRIYIVLALISFLVSVVPIEGLVDLIKTSMMISIMYENNVLISVIL